MQGYLSHTHSSIRHKALHARPVKACILIDSIVFKFHPSDCHGLQIARPCGTMGSVSGNQTIPGIQSLSLDHVNIIPRPGRIVHIGISDKYNAY